MEFADLGSLKVISDQPSLLPQAAHLWWFSQ